MTKLEKTEEGKTEGGGTPEVTFRCQGCGKLRHLDEMRTIKRFFPMLVVCHECEKALR